MIDMERKESKDHRIGGNSLEEIAEGLRNAASRVAKVVVRPGRKLEEGPVLSRLTAWFLLLEPAEQAAIIAKGHELVEHLRHMEEPPDVLDGPSADAIRTTLFGKLSLFPDSAGNAGVPNGGSPGFSTGPGDEGRVVDVETDRKRTRKAKRPAGK